MRWLAFTLHIARVVVWSGVLAVVIALFATEPFAISALATVIVAALVYFATFSLFHDCAHGALGLPTHANDVVLFATSAPMFLSAHGQRQLHLRHHARPLAADDMEGEGALSSLPVALVTAPWASFRMRVASYFAANARIRPWILVENALNVAVVAVAIVSGNVGLQIAAATMLALQLTMNAWASHVPHRAPQWLLSLAAKFAWTHSPVVLSLVYHLEHHAHPRVPCMDLRPNLDVTQSPLLESAAAHPKALAWPQLQLETRPRPKTRA